MTDPDDGDWMTADDLAELLGITRRHLDRIAARERVEGRKRPADRRTWYPRRPFEDALARWRNAGAPGRTASNVAEQPRVAGRFAAETEPQ